MDKYGLIGYPLTHSFSKGYFQKKFEKEGLLNAEYENYPLKNINELPELVRKVEGLKGLNVTIPYKEKIIGFLDELDKSAAEIGAVNTVKVTEKRGEVILKGYNSDVYGFERPLLDAVNNTGGLKALILGTGGASKAVAWVLKKNGIEYLHVSRNPVKSGQISYTDIGKEVIEAHKLIINTSPIGMYPHVDEAPNLAYEHIAPEHILYDLIYNPEETLFLRKGKEKRATIINGLPMLYLQAEKSWEIWNS